MTTDPPAEYLVHRFKKADSERPRRIVRTAGLCRYLDKSQMTLWRWTHDESLNFPKPIVINGVRYFDLDEVDAWIKTRVAQV